VPFFLCAVVSSAGYRIFPPGRDHNAPTLFTMILWHVTIRHPSSALSVFPAHISHGQIACRLAQSSTQQLTKEACLSRCRVCVQRVRDHHCPMALFPLSWPFLLSCRYNSAQTLFAKPLGDMTANARKHGGRNQVLNWSLYTKADQMFQCSAVTRRRP
jgi:hypothetical protein